MWKNCCDKPDLNNIYWAIAGIVGNKIVDIYEGYGRIELTFESGLKATIWGDSVSCQYIGEKKGKVTDVAVSRRGIAIIHDMGVVWIYVKNMRKISIDAPHRKLYKD